MPRLNAPLYESLPALYLTLGLALLWLSYRYDDTGWGTPCVPAGLAAVIAGLVIWMHRRAYRATRGDYLRRDRPAELGSDERS